MSGQRAEIYEKPAGRARLRVLVALLVPALALALCAGLSRADAQTTPPTAQSASTQGADATELWRQGNDAYRRGSFADAIDRYHRALTAGGDSAAGHYALGTAYYRVGKPGLAILHLEKSLALAPRDADAKANLAIVRRHVDLDKQSQELGIGPEGFGRRFARTFTTDEAALTFLVLYYLFFAALIGRRFVLASTVRSLLTIASGVLLVLAILGGSFFAYRLYQQERTREGIILEAKTALMEPHKGAWKAVRQLPAGLRVRIQSQNERWVQIRLANGLSGYVRKAQLGAL